MARQLDMNLYIKHLNKQYVSANRKTKARLLDELCKIAGYHRKHAIALLSQSSDERCRPKKHKRGRKKTYDPALILAPLKEIWFAADQMCGRRLKSAIPLWLPFYESSGALSEFAKQQLLSINSSSINRLLLPSSL